MFTACECQFPGSESFSCVKDTGSCKCRSGYMPPKCEKGPVTTTTTATTTATTTTTTTTTTTGISQQRFLLFIYFVLFFIIFGSFTSIIRGMVINLSKSIANVFHSFLFQFLVIAIRLAHRSAKMLMYASANQDFLDKNVIGVNLLISIFQLVKVCYACLNFECLKITDGNLYFRL